MQDSASPRLRRFFRWFANGSVIATLIVALAAVIIEVAGLGGTWLGLFLGRGVLNFTLRAAVPLTLGALCGILCERSGIINIGIEGMMLAGAFAAFAAKVATNNLPLWQSLCVAVLVALAVGAAMGYIHALLSIRFRVDQIISGTVIIILATGLTTYYFNPDWVSIGKMGNVPIPLLANIPILGPVLFNNGAITYATLALVALLQILLFQSRWGLRMRAVGEHPRAADTVGINVNRTRYINTVLGGVLAGLAGAFLVLEAVGQFREGMTAGRGFISLAAMIFGNWNPVGAFGASLLFGYSQALQNELLLAGITTVPRHFISMLPYVITIVVLAGFVGRARPPAAEGKVYETE